MRESGETTDVLVSVSDQLSHHFYSVSLAAVFRSSSRLCRPWVKIEARRCDASDMPPLFTMDRDNLLKLGLTLCAVGLSFFVLWGPKLATRKSRNSSALIGLQNLGLTCFLNALLQALASCPYVIEWLVQFRGTGRVTDSLLSVLNLLCYERSDGSEIIHGGTFSPRDLISALSQHGWSFTPQEQDAHELFLQLVTTLEEEEQRAHPIGKGSLCDALIPNGGPKVQTEASPNVVTSHGDISTWEGTDPENTNQLEKQHPPLEGDSKLDASGLSGDHGQRRPQASPFRGYLTSQFQCLNCSYKSALRFDKFDALSLHLPPREGSVTLHQMIESFVRTEVLEEFVCEACNKGRPTGSQSVMTKAVKTVKLGKLPKCLCLHISRTNMTADGIVYKKENYVDFPEYLYMGSFTHNAMFKDSKMKQPMFGNKQVIKFPKLGTGNGSDPTLTKFRMLPDQGEVDSNQNTQVENDTKQSSDENMSLMTRIIKNGFVEQSKNNNSLSPSSNKTLFNGITNASHTYRLKAVIEHKGSVDGGHFVTYRRGPLQSNTRHRCNDNQSHDPRWYYTSDADVRKSTMSDALLANAYMLFYEKCSPS